MIFKIENGKTIRESNPDIDIFEKMKECTDREMKWIVLVYDYETPLRKMPMDRRKEKAADMAGFLREKGSGRLDKNARNTLNGKIQRVQEAIKEFMEIQYDEDKELITSYQTQIDQITSLMQKENKTEKEWAILIRLNNEIPKITKAKKDLELVVGYRSEDEGNSEDSEEMLSTLDLLHIEEDEEK